jgi:hypothetical protein
MVKEKLCAFLHVVAADPFFAVIEAAAVPGDDSHPSFTSGDAL